MRHVVALSGGKDSTAMALRLAELEPRAYTFVCTPTGNEPPAMFAHWRRLGELLGSRVVPVVGGSLVGLCESQNALPNWRQRWCTRMLKIAPYAAWLAQQAPAVSYVGLRADEPTREGGDYADVPGIATRYPLREWGWTARDVYRYLEARDVEIPARTDCALCFYQRIDEWFTLWADDRAAFAEGERLEALTGHTFRSPGRDSWPASLQELGAAFAAGRIPARSQQPDLFAGLKCRVCRI